MQSIERRRSWLQVARAARLSKPPKPRIPATSWPSSRPSTQVAVRADVFVLAEVERIAGAGGVKEDWQQFLDACMDPVLQRDDGGGGGDFGWRFAAAVTAQRRQLQSGANRPTRLWNVNTSSRSVEPSPPPPCEKGGLGSVDPKKTLPPHIPKQRTR